MGSSIMRGTRSARLFGKGAPASCGTRNVSVLTSRNRNAGSWPVASVPARCRRERRHAPLAAWMPCLHYTQAGSSGP